jgi:uncharacterized membrane protein YeiH
MNKDLLTLEYLLGMAGTVAFAVTAVLAVTPRGIDVFGACVMGLITAIGGGTIRDLIINVPVFWATDLNYIWVALVASVVTFPTNRLMTRREIYDLMLYIDALGVSMFAIQAVHKVWLLNFGLPLAPILLGVLTAIGGGLIRDVLAGRTNLLMGRELYAIPVTIGCTLYVILFFLLPDHSMVVSYGCTALIFGLRAAAIRWNLRVPKWLMTQSKQD